jgi:hypothetical protein
VQFTWGLRTIAGFKRPVILTNGQYPGPLIDVTEGDRIMHCQGSEQPPTRLWDCKNWCRSWTRYQFVIQATDMRLHIYHASQGQTPGAQVRVKPLVLVQPLCAIFLSAFDPDYYARLSSLSLAVSSSNCCLNLHYLMHRPCCHHWRLLPPYRGKRSRSDLPAECDLWWQGQ